MLCLIFRDKFQQITDLAIQHRADSGKNIDIKSCDLIIAIIVDLCALHFRSVTQLVFADAGSLDQFVQLNSNGTVFVQFHHPTR